MASNSKGTTIIDAVVTPQESTPKAGGALSTLFPPDLDVWNEARRLVSDKNLRVEDLATCCSQDPVVVMDLLKTSNAMFFSGGKSAISSTKAAIVRLGSDVILDVLGKMKGRNMPTSEGASRWLEVHRSRCKRTGIVARIVAEAMARTLADDCQTSALLMFIGEMLAVMHLQEAYVKLADEMARSSVIYRLSQEQKFDVEKMGLAYLRRFGIPEAVIVAFDRDGRSTRQDRVIMKPVCMAAAELVDAFDLNRWEKMAPGRTLPPKSSVRTMQIPDSQYLKIYERCSEYLFSAKLSEESKKIKQMEPESDGFEEAYDLGTAYESTDEFDLQSEIDSLVKGAGKPAEEKDAFSLESAKAVRKTEARVKPEDITQPKDAPQTNSEKAKQMASSMEGLFQKAQTSEELISRLLEMLVDSGPFEKSALIVVSKDRKKALVVAARGPNIGNGQRLEIEDPLSPLAQCFSKIQSFGSRESPNSPFGSKSYALAPIDADHDTPVALYVDCGPEGAVSFEARRTFRVVVEMLNQRLPQVAGGIPIETTL